MGAMSTRTTGEEVDVNIDANTKAAIVTNTDTTTQTSGKPALFHRDFLLVVIGQVISLFANAILRFALPLYILQESGSAALFGIVSAASFIPMIVLSPIGGTIADRVNKQRIMVVLDFFTAFIILVYILVNGYVPVVPAVCCLAGLG